MLRLLSLVACLATLLVAGPAGAGACANLCDGSNFESPAEWSYPQGRTVWEKSDVCTEPRLQVVGEPGEWSCLPDDSWWPFVRVTCLVDGEPIAELKNSGTSGWVGASLCPDGFAPGGPSTSLPLQPILLWK